MPNSSILNVALYAPRIAQNAAQIGRTCFAMGLDLHLIRPLGFRLDAAALERASVGYWKELAPTVHRDGEAFWMAPPDPARVFLIAKSGALRHDRVAYRPGDWLLLGNEVEGLPAGWLEAHAERTVRIPMVRPEARCLNLATAATVVIFEALRRMGIGGSDSPKPMESAPG